MSDRRKHNSAVNQSEIATDFRNEVRRIIRNWYGLQMPVETFRKVERPEGRPNIQVCFGPSLLGNNPPEESAIGLQTRVKRITLPDERIRDRFHDFAGSVWHLKDRIQMWERVKRTPKVIVERRINEHIDECRDLQICGDLISKKKHGAREERSGLQPWLSLTSFDTSKNGPVEFWYDGKVKEAVLLVTTASPVPYRVDVYRGDDPSIDRQRPHEGAKIGNAVDIIFAGFMHWLPLIRDVGILESDEPENNALVEILKPLCEMRPEGGATSKGT